MENLFRQLSRETIYDFEVCLIDDGSADKTVEKAKELYQMNFSGIQEKINAFIILTEKNYGQGFARNTGLLNCHGDYVVFIDQDDMFEPDYLEKLLSVAESENADAVLSGYREVYESGKTKREIHIYNCEWGRFLNIAPWGKIYRRDFLIENGIHFEPLELGEDIYFNLWIYSKAQKMVNTEYIGYSWMINSASFSRTAHRSLKKRLTLFPLLEKLTRLDTYEQWKNDDLYVYFILKTCIYHLLISAHNSDRKSVLEYRKELFAWLDEHFPDYLNNPQLNPTRPKGETANVRTVVWLYMKLYKIGLDKLLLNII